MAEAKPNLGRFVAQIAAVLFVLSFGLRLVGIGWGLQNDLHNQSYHPDELPIFAASQAIKPTEGKFAPGFYNYGTAYLTMLKVSSDVVSAYTGGEDPKSEEATWAWVSRVHFAGRLLSALAGAGVVVAVFLSFWRTLGITGAAIAAAVPALAPALVVHSRFQTVDMVATFFLAMSSMFILRMIPAGEDDKPNLTRLAALAGVFAGLSAGTKYTGILILLSLIPVVIMHQRSAALKLLAVAFGSAFLVFLITTPGLVTDTAKFMEDFRYEMTHTSTGHGLVFEGTTSGFIYHLANLAEAIGPLVFLLGLIGLVWAAFEKKPWVAPVLVFFLAYYLLIGRAEVKFLRYTFPLVIGLAAGFGFLVSEANRRGRNWRLLVGFAIFAIFGVVPRGGITRTAEMTAWMTTDDPRDQAAKFIRASDARTVGLASDPWFYTPPLYKNAGVTRAVPFGERLDRMRTESQPQFVYHQTAGEDPFPFDKRLITEDKPDYIVVSSFEYADPERLWDKKTEAPLASLNEVGRLQVQRAHDFYVELDKSYERAAVFGPPLATLPHDLEYIQPTVLVWKKKQK
jgi:hypothetical protein